ncbi:hypothetical protein LIPSTDRAFT_71831 [Lipomyces starkeyi NRRL Y-11557]|uniref:Uncharacterized protein n=1 Tax=Lipomyces starkeyi NRRL Y-11557 TaxID=675824 RepID=A0A1E3Q3V6_LIPST|nr:hypothetical protein LIPSTDRAFT_71831 [Lipomyces starkeyi NRRL Y-11557]
MEINPSFQLKPKPAVKKRQVATMVSPLQGRQLSVHYCNNFPLAFCFAIREGITYLTH